MYTRVTDITHTCSSKAVSTLSVLMIIPVLNHIYLFYFEGVHTINFGKISQIIINKYLVQFHIDLHILLVNVLYFNLICFLCVFHK